MTNPRDQKRVASKVNTAPRGLQDFAGNVNQGVNPHELNHEVQPAVDILPFWGADKLKSLQTGASVAGALGQGVNVVVPPGEIWMPIAASVEWFVTAESKRAISLRLFDPSGGILIVLADRYLDNNQGSTAVVTAEIVFPNRFLMPSDWGLRGQVDLSNSATAATMEINLAYYKLNA